MFSSLSEAVGSWLGVVPRSARLAGAAVLVLVVVVAAVRMTSGGDNPSGSTASKRPTPATQGGTPRVGEGAALLRRQGSAVLGVQRSTDGAAAAAISYVGQRNALLTGGTTAREAAEVGSTIAVGGRDIGQSPASIPDRVANTSPAAAEAMLKARSGQASSWTVPLGYRVRSYKQKSATVRVFGAVVGTESDAGAGPATIAFSLLDVQLRWREDAWRIFDVVEAADQPTPVVVLAGDSRSELADRPVEERLIRPVQENSTPLHRWLNGATPIPVGPQGMGPVTDGRVLDEQQAAVARDASIGMASLGRKYGTLEGRARDGWRSTAPIAMREFQCPQGANDTARCFSTLFLGTGTQQDRIATVELTLASVVVGDEDGVRRVVRMDIPREQQEEALGGAFQIARTVDDRKRTDLAAWKRSIYPLRPALPAVPR